MGIAALRECPRDGLAFVTRRGKTQNVSVFAVREVVWKQEREMTVLICSNIHVDDIGIHHPAHASPGDGIFCLAVEDISLQNR